MLLQSNHSWTDKCAMNNNRGVFVAVIFSLALNLVSADECPRKPEPATSALKKKLLCNYDRTSVPMVDTTRDITVLHFLYPAFFVFDEYINSLEIHGAIGLEWQDEYLTWTKGAYNGLDKLVMLTTEIWVPHIELQTPASMHSTGSFQSKPVCAVVPNGKVRCEIAMIYDGHCNPDVRRWPFDSHSCNLSVTTRTLRVNLTGEQLDVWPIKFSDRYWRLVDMRSQIISTGIDNSKWPTIVYTFTMERHSGFLIATIFMPSIVMLTATLSAFLLDPAGVARLFLIGANILCHCLFLMYLAWYIPANGDNTPVVLTFFRDSLVLVGVSLVVTVSAATMAAASRAPPGWLSAIADVIHASPARCLLFRSLYSAQNGALSDCEPDNVDAVMAASDSNKWRSIATLLDRLTLLVVAAMLAVLAAAFLP